MKVFPSFQNADVRSDGTVRLPGLELRVGRPSADYTSTAILVFQLPDLKGAGVASITFSFLVQAVVGTAYTDIDLYGVRSSPLLDEVVSGDFTGGTLLGASIFASTTPDPATATLTDSTAFTAWLTAQYTAVGVGGYVFLRLEPNAPTAVVSYYSIKSYSLAFDITTDGLESPVTGTGTVVTCRMLQHEFSWTFDQAVDWGYFIDGQPWIVPSVATNLIAATPTRLNSQSVFAYPSTDAVQIPVTADINITVKNPTVTHKLVAGEYVDVANFGWDSRVLGNTAQPEYNPALGWDGSTPLPVAANDIITTAKSLTTTTMKDRASVLDCLAALTVLSVAPASDAFRPSCLTGGTALEILPYSQLIDLSLVSIPSPVGVTTSLDGSAVADIEQWYTFDWAGQQLQGPGFINSGYSQTEGTSAIFNNSSHMIASASGSYGGYMGNQRFSPLAVGCVADWFTADEKKACRIKYIQRAIDTYGAVTQGLCLEEGAGILPAYSTMILNAGTMMNHTGMKDVDNGVDGVDPWYIFADYATTFHTDGVPSGDLVTGESAAERQIDLYNLGAERPELNKENISAVVSSTANTFTMADSFLWGSTRPMYDVINLKLRIKGGAGASNQTYVITSSAGFKDIDGVEVPSTNVFGYLYGGTVTVKPDFVNGNPDATSVMDFSVTTNKAASSNSDNAKWLWAANGIVPNGTPPYIEKEREISTSPIHNYASIQTGATLGNFLLMYALGNESLYHGGLDKYMIQAGEMSGFSEVLFAGEYLTALDSFRGSLWKQEVLNKVGSTFIYTGNGVADLPIPDSDAEFWNGLTEIVIVMAFYPAGTFNGSNNNWEYPSVGVTLTEDQAKNGYDIEACEGPCLTLADGDTIAMAGHGNILSNAGTATATYNNTVLTVTGAGTIFNLKFTDLSVWPCCEGVGDANNNLTIRSTDGDVGNITAATGAVAVWAATQDDYFFAMDDGWYENTNADGIQYPCLVIF